jgi:dTDP-4-amino-4,6-dideoxygalactose transaminase
MATGHVAKAGDTHARAGASAAVNGDRGKKVVLPAVTQDRHIYNQYILRVLGPGARDRLLAHFKARNVGSEVYYPVPMHLQKCFASLGHKEGDFPHAEAAAKETLAIPVFPELAEEEMRYVVRVVTEFCEKERDVRAPAEAAS